VCGGGDLEDEDDEASAVGGMRGSSLELKHEMCKVRARAHTRAQTNAPAAVERAESRGVRPLVRTAPSTLPPEFSRLTGGSSCFECGMGARTRATR
jgi:hypothetical protein